MLDSFSVVVPCCVCLVCPQSVIFSVAFFVMLAYFIRNAIIPVTYFSAKKKERIFNPLNFPSCLIDYPATTHTKKQKSLTAIIPTTPKKTPVKYSIPLLLVAQSTIFRNIFPSIQLVSRTAPF